MSLGDRKRLRKAAGTQASLAGSLLGTESMVPGASATPTDLPQEEGERRQATVMFSDLSGYTALNEAFDPEEVEAMMETMAHFLSIEHLNGLSWLPPAGPSGYVRLLNAWRRPHKTMDGYLAVMPHSEKQWKKFFTIVGREDVLTDPRFATPELRAGNVDALYIEVSKVLPTRTSAAWSEIFLKHDVPFGLVNSLEDLIEDGHLKDVGFWHAFEHPTECRMRAPSFPVRDGGPKGDATPVTIAPTLGQHTLEVLEGAGYSPAQLQEMVRQGVIGTQWDEKARPASKEA